jgi:sterol desaturase/sphingolipid hydroxylase (fatty acid hydroxylase superfamily)
VDKQTYLAVLLSGQLALVVLDLLERHRVRRRAASAGHLKPGSVMFLAGTIVVYGALQFGGLAMVPSAEELLAMSQAFSRGLLGDGTGVANPALIAVIGVAGFYFAGLCDYLFHRFVGHSRLWWFTHENHHVTTDVSAFMPGLCVRPFAVVVVLPTSAVSIFVVQLVLGSAGYNAWGMTPMLYAVVLAQVTVLGVTHSAFMRSNWWLHRLLKPLGITSPQEHWLHHTPDRDCNYGNFTILWDRVFGTYVDPETVNVHDRRAGLDYDQDFLGAITLSKLKLPDGLRRRYQLSEYCFLKPHR